MNHFSLLLAASLLLALAACSSKKTDQAQAQAPPVAPPPAPLKIPDTGYVMYRGLLAGHSDSIDVNLTISPINASDMGGIAGSYYGADGEPHELRERRMCPDSLVLDEYTQRTTSSDEQLIPWRLRWQPAGYLSGTIGGQAARLRLLRPALQLAVRAFTDSIAAYPAKKHSPYGHLGLQTLVPTNEPLTPALAALGANILRQHRDDTAPNRPVPALPQFWQQQRQEFTSYYRTEVVDLAPEPGDDSEQARYAQRFERQQGLSVICQQGNLLSLSFFDYSYTGGVHGNYGSTVRSFDLRTGQALAFQDIFRPAATTQLLPLLDRAVRRTLDIKRNERLDSRLFDNQIALTTNACLTPGGVLFVYVPYQIASYADGEIRVFVPLAELRPLLREGLPL